jgi:hypothetical protein
VLYQDDDFGKDYVAGLHDALSGDWNKYVVRTATYEVTDPTVGSLTHIKVFVAPFAFMRGAVVGFEQVIAAISGRFREPATDQEPWDEGKEIMSSALLTLERPAGRRKDSELPNGHTGAQGAALKVCFITREYPPNVYGGAGGHIKNLARELAQVMDVEVRCFGDQDLTEGRLRVKGYQPWGALGRPGAAWPRARSRGSTPS